MWLLPWLNEKYTSPQAPAGLLQHLQRHTGKSRLLEPSPDTFFVGTFEEASFNLRRNGWFNTSTYVIGRVQPNPIGAGSVVWLCYRAHLLQVLLEPVRLVFGMALLVILGTRLGATTEPIAWLFLTGIVLFTGLPSLLFRREIHKCRAFLVPLLQLALIKS